MKKIKPEHIYSEWHKQVVYQKTKKYPRPIKNFDKAKFEKIGDKVVETPNWQFFKKFANFCNRNSLVDYKTYMQALGEFYGYILPKNIASHKSLAIYKNWLEKNRQPKDDVKKIKKILLKDIKFVQKYCKENELKSLNEYLMENMNLFPTILRHYKTGRLSPYFIACIPNFKDISISYNKTFVEQSFGTLLNELYQYENKIKQDKKLRQIFNKFEKLFK